MGHETPTTATEAVNAPWPRLGTLPGTNWKLVSGSALSWATTLFLFGLIFYTAHQPGDHERLLSSLVDSLLLFVGGVAGILPTALAVNKRWSFKPGGPEDRAATLQDAAAAADATQASGVTITPPSGAAAATGQPAQPAVASSAPAPGAFAVSVAPATDEPGQLVPGSGD